MAPPEHPAIRRRRAPLALQVLALAAAIVALLAGLWLFASPLSRTFADTTGVPAYWSSIGWAVVWFVVASVALGKVRKERPEFNLPLRVGFLLTVAVVGGVFAWTSLTDDEASDDVSFVEEAMPASEAAQARPTPTSRQAQGATSSSRRAPSAASTTPPRAAPASSSWPAAGGASSSPSSTSSARPTCASTWRRTRSTGDIGEYGSSTSSKGNVGDQYYVLPESVDLERFDNVVIWCKAFDVGVAQAPLAAS